jgi:F0F1-type ATP synthase epsilon subunit
MSNHAIKVVVKDAKDILFQGDVERISSYNEVGQFDVYPMHANFISIIQKELSLYQGKKLAKEFKLEKAIMKVKQDQVNIFLGIESLAISEDSLGELDPENTRAATPVKK